jgi:hypothetical protein
MIPAISHPETFWNGPMTAAMAAGRAIFDMRKS